ncbi:MAG: MerR family transcriptional regulator [Deltaproteobacteria bacterium]|nr:MerR family transcriptional regulator [Deltaproteobacteria bacterium]
MTQASQVPGARAPGTTPDSPPATATPIPDKAYFRIGEVARILGVKPYVLRYWESEFKAIRPQKSRSQQRLYRRRDVELLVRIKKLLYEERFTIAGARRKLRAEGAADNETSESDAPEQRAPTARPNQEFLNRLRTDLERILKLVEE